MIYTVFGGTLNLAPSQLIMPPPATSHGGIVFSGCLGKRESVSHIY